MNRLKSTAKINPLAGKIAPESILINVPRLITAYYTEIPDPGIHSQRVIFGTSGHRGSAFDKTFNEWHILAITQAICLYRKHKKITGPLFLGMDTHAISFPAFASAMEVLAANDVHVMIAKNDEYTPTPVISHAILTYNRKRKTGLADGIVITPSHNPPRDGGFKYNPPTGGPAEIAITQWIENKANELLIKKLRGVRKKIFSAAQASAQHFDYLNHYISDLGNIINMKIIRDSDIHIGVDPLGGAGVHYWEPIADRYKLNLSVISKKIDPRFSFMTVDWDGNIRMNPASPYAMVRLIKMKNDFDIAFACDTDHDRHGVVTPQAGLLPPNHYFSAAISYLLSARPRWPKSKNIAKSIVTTEMLNRVTNSLHRSICEVPVGFKWFVSGLFDGNTGFCCEESAGATFDRLNGEVWTTDKDGIVSGLLAAEITAGTNHDLGAIYQEIERDFGKVYFSHINQKATLAQKLILKNLTNQQITTSKLAGKKIQHILTKAPGNNAPIDGIKVMTEEGWFVARPSGTEEIYEIYAESYRSKKHLQQILDEANRIVARVLKSNLKS